MKSLGTLLLVLVLAACTTAPARLAPTATMPPPADTPLPTVAFTVAPPAPAVQASPLPTASPRPRPTETWTAMPTVVPTETQAPATRTPRPTIAPTQAPPSPTLAPAFTATSVPAVIDTQAPAPTAPPAVTGYVCDGGQACIKGNISSDGRKLYHYPGCPSYNATRIDESKGERWFVSEAEAQAAGWVRAGNC